MTKPARRARYWLSAAVTLTVIASPCAAFAGSDGTYLDWNNKSRPATPQRDQVQTSGGTYAIPASPYGQVGDPYGSRLRWPAKQATTATVAANLAPPQQTYAPLPAAPIHAPAPVSLSRPVPMTAPRPVAVVPIPQASSPQTSSPLPPEPEDPGLADDPDLTPETPVMPQKPAIKPRAAAASAPPSARTETAPTPPAVAAALSGDGAYEVPATSKYAARIAAARTAQLPTAEAPEGKPGSKSTATAPEPNVSLATQETDHVFIPGEQYKTPADEPRFYSLHRQYGMKPDPIEVSQGATGALLTVSPDDQAGDPNDDDTDKKSDTDKN